MCIRDRTEALRITSSGNLLLGTTSDTQRLHVYNGNGAAGYKTALFNSNDTANGTRIVFANSGNTSGRGLGINVGGQTYGPGQNKASFGWYNTDNTFATYHSIMTITSDAKIGINQSSPTSTLHVVNTTSESTIAQFGQSSGARYARFNNIPSQQNFDHLLLSRYDNTLGYQLRLQNTDASSTGCLLYTSPSPRDS